MSETYVDWSDSTSNETDRISFQSMLSRLDDINRRVTHQGLPIDTIIYFQQFINSNINQCQFRLGKCSITITKVSRNG